MRSDVGIACALVVASVNAARAPPIALHGEIFSFRRNVVEFVTSVRHSRLAAWLGDVG